MTWGTAFRRAREAVPRTSRQVDERPDSRVNTTNDSVPRGADRLLLRAAAHGGGWLGIAAVTAVLIALLETALPGVLGRAVDAVVGVAPGAWIAGVAVLVALLALTDALNDLASGFATARSTAWLRRGLLHHFVRIGMRAPERYAPGDLATRLVGNALTTGRAGVDIVRTLVNVLPAAGALVALGLIDPWLLLTVAVGIPGLFFMLRSFLRDASGLAARYFALQGAIAARLSSALAGARTIAASGTEEREASRVLSDLPQLHAEGAGMWNAQARIAMQHGLLVPLLEVAVLAVAGVELTRGRISPGGLLAAAQYAALATSLVAALPALTRLVRARAAAVRVHRVMLEPVVAYGQAAAPPGNGTIEMRGVTVRASDRVLLDHADLTFPGGELTAIVGRSGAGKSLVAALAGRLIDPDEGEVLLDGVSLRDLDHDALRGFIGYAFERPALFGDTIADAIGFGVLRPEADEVVEAAQRGAADDFIRRLPGGYANPMASTPLSGGEVQRLGLARAFAHAGRVLILDDVAASLDTATDYRITGVLTAALAGRTRIVVAHRAATASRADTVVWLDAGRVRAVASHAELWENVAYRAVFEPGLLARHANGHRRRRAAA